MKRAERAAYIRNELARRYPNPPIPLDHKDPYTLLIAVLLSAQCTDKRVNLVTPDLFALADTPAKMVALEVDTIQSAIRSCGLAPMKAKSISGLSRVLLEQYGGVVPADFAALESLPGVGHKTASVVMCQAFGVAAFPVDTHIHRLAGRWRLSQAKNVGQTERDLKKLFPSECWRDLHLQMIYYGREHCTARGCNGHRCPICAVLFPPGSSPSDLGLWKSRNPGQENSETSVRLRSIPP